MTGTTRTVSAGQLHSVGTGIVVGHSRATGMYGGYSLHDTADPAKAGAHNMIWPIGGGRGNVVFQQGLTVMPRYAGQTGTVTITTISANTFQLQPGNENSPWNRPLSAANTYGGSAPFSALSAGLSSWSGNSFPIWYATYADPVVSLLYCSVAQANTANSTWAHTGNNSTIEAAILAASTNAFPNTPFGASSKYNYQSTSHASWVLPGNIAAVGNLLSGGAQQVSCPKSAVPCNDSDGHMAVYQPSGMVLETYATIILSNGTIVCGNWNLTDPTGLVDGYSGGVTASCLPNYAGLIKQTDLNQQLIQHALALAIPATQLVYGVTYPAATFDRSTVYSGTFTLGTRFAIPASVNLATVRSWESVEGPWIAAAAQTYGCYAVDTGGGGVTIRIEAAVTNPEVVDAPGSPDFNLFDDVTWIVQHLQQVTS